MIAMRRRCGEQGWWWAASVTLVAAGALCGEAGAAGEAELVVDLNVQEPGSSPAGFIEAGGVVYFVAHDQPHGQELWRTNGTGSGTSLVKDIRPGPAGSAPGELTAFGGLLVFVADDGVQGAELWRSDGTPEGTFVLHDLEPGPGSSRPCRLTAVEGRLFFAAFGDFLDIQLWVTDGTPGGAALVSEFEYGTETADLLSELTASNGLLFFSLHQGLWVSDGTETGTAELVADVRPQHLTPWGEWCFFAADADPSSGSNVELWKSDGTVAGTELAADVNPAGSSDPRELVPAGGGLYFSAAPGASGSPGSRGLWKTDGTTAGTELVAGDPATAACDPQNLVDFAGSLLFAAQDAAGLTGIEPWSSDGTGAGTSLVADIAAGEASSLPRWLTSLGSVVLFTAEEAVSGRELWLTDGTGAGTELIGDLRPGEAGSTPAGLTAVGGEVFFRANDGQHGLELWASDGSAAGTALVANLEAGTDSSWVRDLTVLGGRVFFAAEDSLYGTELWSSDGTAAGTTLIQDLRPGTAGSMPRQVFSADGFVYFTANDGTTGFELWRCDGVGAPELVADLNTGGGNSHPHGFVPFLGDVVFFAAADAGDVGLYRSDGTPPGTVLLEVVDGEDLVALGDLLFLADDREIWLSDGTPGGATLVGQTGSDSWGSQPDLLTACGERIYFRGGDTAHGIELWQVKEDRDGWALGAVIDLYAGEESSNPEQLICHNGTLFFTAEDGTHGRELWRLTPGADPEDPTVVMVADLNAGPDSSAAGQFVVSGDWVYFTADDGLTGVELWRVHAGTFAVEQVADIEAGPAGGRPRGLLPGPAGGEVLFVADQAAFGAEAWLSDGTPQGTGPVADVVPGPVGSNPRDLAVCGARLFFAANNRVVDDELWTLCLGATGDFDCDGSVDLADHAVLAGCLTGPGAEPLPECERADLDGDQDVDLADHALLQAAFGG